MSSLGGIHNILLMLSVVLSTLTAIQSANCPDPYRRYSNQHSYCLGGCCACPFYKRGISDGLKNQILFVHNNLRSKVAGGQSYGVDHLPRATNMLEMVWDEELATMAQKWLYGCKRTADCEECRMVGRFQVGQNILDYEGSEMDSQDLDMEFFSRFMAVGHFKENNVKRYDGSASYRTAQLLWAKTWRIGCGFLYFKDPSNGRKYSILKCNYGPSGNIEGEEVYKAGKACSACPANSCCGDGCKKHKVSAKYHGLCKIINENLPPEGNVPHEKSDKEVFYCGFNGESDCDYTVEGVDRWIRNVSTGGTWISTYLGSQGYTVLNFEKPITSKSGKLCLSITTRSGPMEADKVYKYELSGRLEESGKYMTSMVFPNADEKVKHMLHTDYFQPTDFPKNREVRLTLSFSVADNSPRQYIEIRRIVAEEKDCPKSTIEEGAGFSTSR